MKPFLAPCVASNGFYLYGVPFLVSGTVIVVRSTGAHWLAGD
jgi:hypothetical protein